MSMQIIYGRAHCGKTGYVMELVKQLNLRGEQVILVVPEQFTHIAEIRLLQAVGKILDGEIEIMSFKKLAQRCFDIWAGENYKQIDSVGRSLIAARAVENCELKYFKNSKDFSGFVELALKEISNFKKYSIAPDDIKNIVNSSKAQMKDSFKLKMEDLLNIYLEYDRILHQEYIDSEDNLDILKKILKDNNILKDKTIIFDEFSTFIPQEEAILAELTGQCKNVYVTLCLDSVENGDMNIFMPTITTYNKLKDICKTCGYKFEKPLKLENSYYNDEALAYLEKNLYSYPVKRFDKNQDSISLFKAKNPFSEVEYVADKIISLVRDENIRFKDIGIICSDINAYSHIFKIVFDKYQIPYFIDEKIPVLKHHIIQYVINIFEVYISGYRHESIFNYLKSGFCDIDAMQVAICENFALRTNITRRTWLDDEKWDTILNHQKFRDKAERDILCTIRKKYILPLAKFHEDIKGRNKAEYVCKRLIEFLKETGLDANLERLSSEARQYEDRKSLKMAKEYESIWNVLINSLETLYEFCSNETVTPEEFKNYLVCALNEQTIGLIPTSLDEIIIGDIKRTKTEYTDILFIIGANDGVFPSKPAGDMLLTDKDKAIIEDSGFEYTKSITIQSYYNQFLIYSVFTLANKKIFISYSSCDNDYKTLTPAFIVGRIGKIFNIKETSDDVIYNISFDKVTTQNVTFEYLSEVMNELICKDKNIDDVDKWHSLYGYYKEKYPEKIKKLESFLKGNKPVYEKINTATLNRLMGDELYTTVSRLQRYNACKYSYFLSYLLDLKKPQTNEIRSIDIGNTAHSVFEYIGKKLISQNKDYEQLTDADIQICVDEYLSELINQYSLTCDGLSARQKFILERMKNELELCLKIIRNQIIETRFVPMGYEIEFSDKTPEGTINIKLDDGRVVKLTGKIDRADVLKNGQETYVRIIDYKTGSKTFNLSDIVNGTDIQLIVYLNALVKSNDNYLPAGAFYFTVQDPLSKQTKDVSDEEIQKDILSMMKLKGIVLDDDYIKKENTDKKSQVRVNSATKEQFEIMEKYITKIIKKSLTELLGGNISANPVKNRDITPCLYCEYKSICRFEFSDNNYTYTKNYSKAEEAWEVMYNEMDT